MNRAAWLALLPPLALSRVEPAQLQFTLGEVQRAGRGVYSDSPKLRAVAPGFRGTTAELRFTYLGPTSSEAALASGERRRQLGLKLRARDGCNLVYVMWRIAPEPKLVVSVKENPGERSHEECGARGYRNVRPAQARPAPALLPGAQHALRAQLDGVELRVWIDGAPIWTGAVADRPLSFDGPIGLRADNARIEFELWGRAGRALRLRGLKPRAR